jgi:hypothetical protein
MRLQLGVKASAVFDAEHMNRFILRRTWAPSLPKLGCCLTNPSTASEQIDDPTLRKLQMFARLWGFGSVAVVNAFPWCATNPKELHSRKEDCFSIWSNERYILDAVSDSDLFLCGWGAHAKIDSRSRRLRQLLSSSPVYALRLIGSGEPEHPLYLPKTLKPRRFDMQLNVLCEEFPLPIAARPVIEASGALVPNQESL